MGVPLKEKVLLGWLQMPLDHLPPGVTALRLVHQGTQAAMAEIQVHRHIIQHQGPVPLETTRCHSDRQEKAKGSRVCWAGLSWHTP